MRAVLALVLCVAACRQEPNFDERYSDTQNRIAERANALDAEINSSSDSARSDDSD